MLPLSESALDRMVADARNLGDPPLTDWDSLSVRLRSEGLIRETFGTRVSRLSSNPMLRIAAALLIAAGGAVVGRASAGVSPIPAAGVSVASDPAEASGVEVVSNTGQRFTSAEEAWDVLNRSGEEYQAASAFLAESNGAMPLPQSSAQYRTRLAALDNVMSEMRDAMRQAPQDPVINQYYMATVGAREATLRQLGTVLPASARMNRF